MVRLLDEEARRSRWWESGTDMEIKWELRWDIGGECAREVTRTAKSITTTIKFVRDCAARTTRTNICSHLTSNLLHSCFLILRNSSILSPCCPILCIPALKAKYEKIIFTSQFLRDLVAILNNKGMLYFLKVDHSRHRSEVETEVNDLKNY